MLVKPKLGDDVLQTDMDQTEAINISLSKKDILLIKETLPNSGTTKNVIIPFEFDNSFILSYKARNANGVWTTGVGSPSLESWGVRISLYNQNITISNGTSSINGNEIQIVLLRNGVFK